MTPEDHIKGILARDRRALAKAITLMESRRAADQADAASILEAVMAHTGAATRLGITGVPGVGKSTFIEALGLSLTERGHRVAVLAVDPSSTRTGGSIMADKTRMAALSVSPAAFVRPSPSGGSLGGVARRTREAMLLCEAAGFDVVIVETVGTGQSETRVAAMVDFFLVLLLPGGGDELQGIKRGVMELADGLAVNKADGANRELADQTRLAYAAALSLIPQTTTGWEPSVAVCSAITGEGIDALWQAVLDHRQVVTQSGQLDAKRRGQAVSWMWAIIEDRLMDRFRNHPTVVENLADTIDAVASGRLAPGGAAEHLFFSLDNPGSELP